MTTPAPGDDQAKSFSQDRRQSPPVPAEEGSDERSLFGLLAPLIDGFRFQDIFSARPRSKDFIETRAEYIAVRLRLMIFFYAIAVPLWTPADYLLLSPEHFNAMLIPKFLLTAVLLPLGLLALGKRTSNQIHVIFALTIAAAGLFYFVSMRILSQGAVEPSLAGYSFMPFMMVSMLGVFPLTLVYGVGLIVVIMTFYLGLEVSLGRLMTVDTANMLWVFFILGGISLWAQSSQLLMLLKLYRESTRDALTGLINRRVLIRRLATEIARVSAGGPAFSILMFDLDRFKRINDNYGHLTGDKVLKITASLLQKGVRKNDIVARFGGEEFVAVLSGFSSKEAIAVAERIRASCYATKITAPNGDVIQLSTSVGVTEHETGEAIEITLNRADEALYKAKETGRNRVVHGQSDRFGK